MNNNDNNIKILSWNILMYITRGQDVIQKAENLIYEIKKLNPDVLCLQEASTYFLTLLCEQTNYMVVMSELTHGGICCTLVKKDMINDVRNPVKFFQCGVKCVIGNNTIINCHLVPGFQNHGMRLSQINEMIGTDINTPIVLIGDTNMGNDQQIDKKWLVDAAIFAKNQQPTWFCSYFDKKSKATKRFDRAYTNVKFTEFAVYPEFTHLSDHIPISIKLN
jgi:endonuclease/exonuclease/phosphatase family metal-dependent hydrolase